MVTRAPSVNRPYESLHISKATIILFSCLRTIKIHRLLAVATGLVRHRGNAKEGIMEIRQSQTTRSTPTLFHRHFGEIKRRNKVIVASKEQSAYLRKDSVALRESRQ